ncbi:LuxR C-terminal-related transcriptional regulator [Streptomyces sp. NBC_01381]|uniref:helix-turn-helix transcriptional regulator n=1 Tax=Streptomyces sp. NBC_01381 TaxID=2903845 RepID=UPI00224FF27A|nr:LuxR C-terminal-related transcriptional regulator [Streptomyces sp. NBC_01381]MCX4669159.1 LuxR C-terminal-related transcriptional regulator [Streptomyces sp. NBC_01381]
MTVVRAVERTGARAEDLALALYAELRRRGASDFEEAVAELGLGPEERERCRRELLDLGLVVPTGAQHDNRLALAAGEPSESETDSVAVVSPEMALIKLLEGERGRLREDLRRAEQVNGRLESLATRFLRSEVLAPSAEVEVEVITDYRRIQQALEDITETVEHELSALQPLIDQGREIPERALSRDRRQIAKGVRVRYVFSASGANTPQGMEHLARKAAVGAELRISADIPMNMIIADRRFALLPVDPERHAAGAILARGPALVRSYSALYEHLWRTATPYGEQGECARDSSGLTEQQRAALRMLATGMKDEKIARGLGVSLRTVSRILSELMQELGASSRFEAGVQAMRLGWLD